MVTDVGFFRELPHGDPEGPSLREALGKGEAEVRDHIADYLTNGSILATTSEQVYDVLKTAQVYAGKLAIQTDGRWLWPADLAYYVAEYNVLLPADFVAWMRTSEWVPPRLSVEELVRIQESIVPQG